jgi:hypothetical protein
LLKETAENPPLTKKDKPTKAIQRNSSHDGAVAMRNGVHKQKSQAEPLKSFQVKIVRTGNVEMNIAVDAKSISEAEASALELVKVQRFHPDEVHDEVKSITQQD